MNSHSFSPARGPHFARWVFGIAGVYGILVMLMSYANPGMATGGQPVTMPEWYYGFVGVTLTWQVVFLLIAADPIRYRPLMLVAAVGEKGLFVVAMIVLLATHRVAARWAGPVAIDAVLGMAFLAAHRLTR